MFANSSFVWKWTPTRSPERARKSQMEKDSNSEVTGEAPTEQRLDSGPIDTQAEFEAWLDKLRPRKPIGEAKPQSPSLDHLKPDFFVNCTDGDCLISFVGVMHIEGFVSANIRSDDGTLITGSGLIDGNIDVAVAHIDGSVIGYVKAGDRVVLYSEAKVAGNIVSSALSTKPGALFEGDCILHESIARRLIPLSTEAAAGEFVDQFQGV